MGNRSDWGGLFYSRELPEQVMLLPGDTLLFLEGNRTPETQPDTDVPVMNT